MSRIRSSSSRETRVLAQGVEQRLHPEIAEPPAPLLEGAVEPLERGIGVAEGGVHHDEGDRGYVRAPSRSP